MSNVQCVEARHAFSPGGVNALVLTREEWRQLQRSYVVGDLLMPCCNGHAIPKVSPNGYQFFAHASGACSSSEESQWHHAAKHLVRATLEMIGCVATVEEPGSGDSGRWQSDVWGERAGLRLAVEIQRSYQSLEDYRERHKKYRAASVAALWLLREDRYSTLTKSMAKERLRTEFGGRFPPGGFGPCLPEIPVARLQVDEGGGAKVTGAGFFDATLAESLDAALTGRFLWRDGLWCIDSLDAMLERARQAREANARRAEEVRGLKRR